MAFRTFSIPNHTLTSHAHTFRLRVACHGFPEHIFTIDLTEGQTVHVLSGVPWDASCALNRLCSNGATAKPSHFRAVPHDSSVGTTIVAISALPLLATPPCFFLIGIPFCLRMCAWPCWASSSFRLCLSVNSAWNVNDPSASCPVSHCHINPCLFEHSANRSPVVAYLQHASSS